MCQLTKFRNVFKWSVNFSYYIKGKMSKVVKRKGIIKKISKKICQYSLITKYKSFVRTHFDYGDVIYDLTNNERFSQK